MGARVATTQWSQVLAARDGSQTEARVALVGLCQTYWQPLYAYVRHQGATPDEARDLTQGFFAEFLDKDFLADVDPEKGRFRSFLLASLRHFLSHERDRDRALKRGGGATTLSLDVESAEDRYAIQAATAETPDEVFERRWAMTVLDRALERLADEEQGLGHETRFQQLQPYLTSQEPQVPYRDAARALGMSEGAIKIAVHRLRKRFGQALRSEIAETVADPMDTNSEVRHLLAIIRL